MDNDDFLVGLGGDRGNGSTKPASSSADLDDASFETADRLMRRLEGESETRDLDQDPAPKVIASTVAGTSWPDDAVTAPDGNPFTDFDSANYKAQQMASQTGDEFLVTAVSSTQFVVVSRVVVSNATPSRTSGNENASSESDRSLSYLSIPLKELKIDDFPPNHAVHKLGLDRYKKYMKKGFKFKPAYRSMWPLLTVATFGLLVFLLPVPFVNLLPQDMITKILASIPEDTFLKGISLFAAALGSFALIKVLIQRHSHRYMLMDGFAKYECGIISRDTTKIAYSNISNQSVDQSILGRILNYGDMELASPGTGDAEIKMQSVLAPHMVLAVLEGRIAEARQSAR